MSLNPQLLEVLACPIDKGTLVYLAGEATLYNPRLRRAYDVVDGIPVMLVDASREVGDDEHERLMAAAATDEVPGSH